MFLCLNSELDMWISSWCGVHIAIMSHVAWHFCLIAHVRQIPWDDHNEILAFNTHKCWP